MLKLNQSQEVMLIGDDFVPGAQANSEIDHLLGYNTHMLDDKAIRSENFGCSLAPDYCGDIEPTRQELEKLGVDPLITPSLFRNDSKRKTKNVNSDSPYFFTASFVFNDEQIITKPYVTEELALSCALWYVLAYLT